MKIKNEICDSDLHPLSNHSKNLEQIAVNNKLKVEAAMNEEFELAIEYKKQITELEKQLITDQDFELNFWSKKPLLTEQEVYLKLVDIDATFAKNFSEKAFSQGKSKS